MTSVHASATIVQQMRKVIVGALITFCLLGALLWINSTNTFQVASEHPSNQLTPVQVAPLLDSTPNAKCGGIVAPC